MRPMTEVFQHNLESLRDIEKNVPPKHINQIKEIEVSLIEYQKWDEARAMVINHLMQNHGLRDPYQWAYKTIELLKSK